MSLSNLVIQLNKFLPLKIVLPYYVNDSFPLFVSNLRYKKLFPAVLRIFVIASTIFYMCFALSYLIWLKFHWNQPISDKIVQLVMYQEILCMTCAAISFFWFLNSQSAEFIRVLNQRFQILPIMVTEDFTFHKFIIWQVALGHLAFPPLGLIVPLVIDYTPLQLILSWVYLDFIIELKYAVIIFESITYSLLLTYGAIAVLSILSLFITVVDGINTLSGQFVKLPGKEFMKAYKMCQRTRVLINGSNEVAKSFMFNLISAAVILASSAGYMVVTMRSELPLILLLACATLFLMVVATIILVMLLADVPGRNGRLFFDYWKNVVHSSPQYSRMLKACPVIIGFQVGCFRSIQRIFGPRIVDIIVQITATLILLK